MKNKQTGPAFSVAPRTWLTGLSCSKFGYRYPTDKSLSHTLNGAMLSQCYSLAFITNPATPKTGCPHIKYDIPAQTALNGNYSNLSEPFTMQRNIWKVGWRQRSGQADGNKQTGLWQIMWPASIPPSPRTWPHSPSCAWEKKHFPLYSFLSQRKISHPADKGLRWDELFTR